MRVWSRHTFVDVRALLGQSRVHTDKSSALSSVPWKSDQSFQCLRCVRGMRDTCALSTRCVSPVLVKMVTLVGVACATFPYITLAPRR